MTNYAQLIYPEDKGNPYPAKFANYLYERFMSSSAQGERKILDIGCSRGQALNNFKKIDDNLDLYGVDLRNEGTYDNITFKACNLESEPSPFEDNTFDIVYSKSVLEHVFNTGNFISEAHRVLKPGGVCVMLAPDWRSQQSYFWDDYTHVKPFTRKGLRDCLIMHDFEKVDCEYFYQLPFLWKRPYLGFIPKIVSILPQSFKWKSKEERNTKDRKFIRFCKEQMLLVYGLKS